MKNKFKIKYYRKPNVELSDNKVKKYLKKLDDITKIYDFCKTTGVEVEYHYKGLGVYISIELYSNGRFAVTYPCYFDNAFIYAFEDYLKHETDFLKNIKYDRKN